MNSPILKQAEKRNRHFSNEDLQMANMRNAQHDYCCYVLLSSPKLCRTLLWPHGLKPASVLCPWDFLGKDTGRGLLFPSPYILIIVLSFKECSEVVLLLSTCSRWRKQGDECAQGHLVSMQQNLRITSFLHCKAKVPNPSSSLPSWNLHKSLWATKGKFRVGRTNHNMLLGQHSTWTVILK